MNGGAAAQGERSLIAEVKAVAYPCQERGGVVWTYMGTRGDPPPLPVLEPNMLDDGDWTLSIYQRECNWMQALEGDIDTSHTVFLHTGSLTEDDAPEGSWAKCALSDRAPRYEVVTTDAGVMYSAYRPADTESLYYRICPVSLSLLRDGADRRAGARGARAGLGPDGRLPHPGAQHVTEWSARGGRPPPAFSR